MSARRPSSRPSLRSLLLPQTPASWLHTPLHARLRAWIEQREAPPPAPVLLMEALEPRLLLSADLAATSATLDPTALVAGQTAAVTVQLLNAGSDMPAAPVHVALYASTNAVLDASDVPVAAADVDAAAFVPGVAFGQTLSVDSGALPAAGSYTLLGRIDPQNAIAEGNEANNDFTVSSPLTVLARLGAQPGGGQVSALTLTDADGTRFTLAIGGPGSVEVSLDAGGYRLAITGSDANTTLTLAADGGDGQVAISGLTADAALGTVSAAPAVLTGPAVIAGALKSLSIGGTAAGASLSALSLGSLTVGGDWRGDLRLAGAGASAYTLGPVQVGGALGGHWQIGGRAYAIAAGSSLAGWIANVQGTLAQFTTQGNAAGTLAVAALQLLQVGGDLQGFRLLVGSDFGGDGLPGGSGAAADTYAAGTLTRVRVTGNAHDSLIAVGLDPRNSQYGDGDDALLGGAANRLQELIIGGQITGSTAIVAPALPASVRVGGQTIAPASLPALGTQPRDSVAPTLSAALTHDTGAAADDGLTNDPGIGGQVSDAGGITALRLSIDGGSLIDITRHLGTDGRFTLAADTPELAALGKKAERNGSPHTLGLLASDAAGNVSALVTVAFTLDTVPPKLTTPDLDPASDTGTPGDRETTAATVTLVGQSEAGATIELPALGLATLADADGNFAFTGLALAPGANAFTLAATDRAGNRRETGVTLTRTLPDTTAPTLSAALASDTGISATDGITMDATVSGTAGDDTGVVQLLGALDPAAADSPLTDLSTALQADGHFTLDAATLAALAGDTLADGAHVLRLAAVDAAGNRTQTEVAFTLDTLAPDVPTLGLDAASDSGASANDGITADPTPTLQIGADSGTTLRLLRDGTDLGPVLAGSLTLSTLADGTYLFTVLASDAAGNQATSGALTLLIDTVAPDAPIFDLDAASDTGTPGDHDTTLATVTLHGSSSPGARLTLDGTALTTLAAADGSFTLAGVALADGANLLTLSALDTAGNRATGTLTITRSQPSTGDTTAPTLTAALASDTGSSATDGITKDATVSGTAGDDTGVVQLLGTLDPTSADSPLTDLSTALQADGHFTLDAATLATLAGGTLADGAHVLRLAAIDAAGNRTQTEVAFTLDTLAPTLASVGLAASADTGTPGDGITSAARVLLTGTATAGDRISVLGQTVSALAGAGGVFQLADVALDTGENQLNLQLSDRAGNTGSATLTLTRSSEASQDAVLDWVRQALEAVRRDATDPPIATRWLAMESLAVYDTLAAIDGTPAYLTQHTVSGPVSTDAAVASAAYRVLVRAYPAQQAYFDAALATSLAAIADGAARSNGIALGQAVADDVLALRAADGADDFVTYPGSSTLGAWRPTGPMYEVADEPQWGGVTPFALASASEFRPAPPPALDSAEYAASVEEIRALGSATSTVRTADQTQQAQFWADGAGTYSPPGHWVQIAAQLAASQGNSLAANARLFAQINVALADAAIAAWDAKYTYGLWRPETAIANADVDGNAATVQDAGWTSLLITPSHPEYVSGHSTFSAAAAGVLDAVFGADTAFTTTSFALPGITRSFTSFDAAAAEAGRSRVYGGIHYEFTNQAGQQLGHQVADAVLARFALGSDTQAPGISTDAVAAVVAANPTLSGRVLDNLAGVAESRYRLDGGTPQALVLDAEGRYAITTAFALDGSADGVHTLTLDAVDAAGNVATTVTRRFTLDTRAPALTLASLADGDLLTAASRLTGSADPTGSALTELSYTLDGQDRRTLSFDAGTGAFDAALDITRLGIGSHTLTLSARDSAGNLTTLSRALTLDQLAPFTVTGVTPTDASSEVGVTFRPQVFFSRAVNTATLNANSLYATAPDGTKIAATIVPALDGSFAWLFFTDPLPGGATLTLHVEGSKIRAASDGAFLDADGDAAAGGTLTTTFTTVSTTPVLGTKLVGRVVDPGPDLLPMTFDDIGRGPDGVIHTADDVFKRPIAHAKVWILGRESDVVYTDANGYFELTSVPVGDVKLAVDGRTASNAPTDVFFPEMVMDLTLRPGITNTAMGSMGSLTEQQDNADRQEIYLPRIATSVLQTVSDTGNTVITLDQAAAPDLTPEQRAALTLTVPAGSAIGENGEALSNVQIGVATVPPELVRDMLPPGVLEHTFDITIQAPGVATFAEPVQITFPNVFNAAPGTKLNILSFDHTTGRLVINGTGTVSADGLTVVSDPDSGIKAPGWHGLTPPGGEQSVNVGNNDGDRNQNGQPDIDENPNDDDSDKDYRVSLSIDFTVPKDAFYITPFFEINLPEIGEKRFDYRFDTPESDIIRSWSVGSYDFSLPSWSEWLLPDYKQVKIFDLDAKLDATAAIGADLKFRFDSLLNSVGFNGTLGLSLDAKIEAEISGGLLDWLPENVRDWLDGPWSYQIPTLTYGGIKIPTTRINLPNIPDYLRNVGFEVKAQAGADFGGAIRFTPQITLQRLNNNLLANQQSITLSNWMPQPVILAAFESAATPETSYGYSDSRGFGTDPKIYYRYQLEDGTEIAGFSDPSGNFKTFLPANSSYTLSIYRPSTNAWEILSNKTTASGQQPAINISLNQIGGFDSDLDSIPDIGEYIIGTKANLTDSDLDGISDSAELEQGLDPLGGLHIPTGIVSNSNLQDSAEAISIAALNDKANELTAFIATGTNGLALIDVSQFTKPITLSQINLDGINQDVAVDTTRNIAAVAAGEAGLHLVSITDRSAPTLLQTLSFTDAVRAVAIRDGFAFVAAGSTLAVVDLNTGEVRQSLGAGIGVVTDLALDGDTLYAVRAGGALGSYVVSGETVMALDTLLLPASGGKLFVGGGVAYVGRSDGFNGGFSTVNVSDPAQLRLISGPDTNNIAGGAIAANGSGLAVAVGRPGGVFGANVLDVLNVRDPADTSAFITRINLPAEPRDVALANGLAFVADGTGGLQIVNYAAFDNKGIPPQVSLTVEGVDVDPATPGIQVLEGRTVRVIPTVSDDVQVRNVELLVNGQVVSNAAAFPFGMTAQVPTIAQGGNTVTLQVRATDTGGNSTLSNLVTLNVMPDTFPPQLSKISVAEGDRRFFVKSIDLTFDEPLDTDRLDGAGIRLVRAGADGAFGTADDASEPVRLDFRASGQKVSILTNGYLTPGNYELRIDKDVISDRAGNVLTGNVIRHFTVLSGGDVKAATGNAATGNFPSANPGQQIGIVVPFDPSTAKAQIATIDANGNKSATVVTVSGWDAARHIAYFNIPLSAVTGDAVVYSVINGTRTDFGDGTFPLQIVPLITSASLQSVASDGSTMQVLLGGYGFTEGAGSYRFGSTLVTDSDVNTGPDVGSFYDYSLNRYVSGVLLTVPVSPDAFGAISASTAGGSSSAFTVSLSSISATALSGTPTDANAASANPGQAVTLNGAGLTTATGVLLHYTDQYGTDRTVLLKPSAAAADGTAATLLIPDYANGVTRLQVLDSANQPVVLQIVPVVSGFDAQYTNRLQIDGRGFVEGATTYLFAGASLTDTDINAGPDVTYAYPSYIENGTAYVDGVAHGFGSIRVNTTGGTSAPFALNVLDPVQGALGDVALAADGSLWVIDSSSFSRLLHIDVVSGALLGGFSTNLSTNNQASGLQVVPQAFTLGNTSVPTGSLLVTSGNQIHAYAPDSGALLTTLTLPSDGFLPLNNALYDPASRHLFGSTTNTGQIVELDPHDGTQIANFASNLMSNASLSVDGLALDASTGHLWVVSSYSQEAVELTKTGSVVSRINLASQHADSNEASGIAVAAGGALLVSSVQGQVYRIDPAADSIATLASLKTLATNGTPANAAQASANVGQVIELTGSQFNIGTLVLFATRDNDGKAGLISVKPLLVSADGTRLQVQVPDLATTGEIRVVNHGTQNLGGNSSYTDSVYRRISVNFVAGSNTATMHFADNGLDYASNASWGIDNVRVTHAGNNVFADDFEANAMGQWHDPRIDTASSATLTRFSGRFGSDANGQTLTLDNLQAGGTYTLTFDLYALDQWNSKSSRPDRFQVVIDGTTVLDKTLDNSDSSAQSLRASVSQYLQIIPTISSLSGRPGSDSAFALTGSGFMEGASAISIGGTIITDYFSNLSEFNVTGSRNSQYTNIYVPHSVEGPIRVTTAGGYAELTGPYFGEQPSVYFGGITARATLGAVADSALPSANTSQMIELSGLGFTSNTLVQFEAIDDSGTLGTLTRTGTVSNNGTKLTVRVPALAHTGLVHVLGSNSAYTLQIVPTLRAFGSTVITSGDMLLLEGSGLSGNDLVVQIDGRSVSEFSVQTVIDGNSPHQQLLRLIVPTGIGDGVITVSTAGGSSSISGISTAALADIAPATDIGDVLGSAIDSGLSANQSISIRSRIDSSRDVDLVRVNLNTGDRLIFNMGDVQSYAYARLFDATGTAITNTAYFSSSNNMAQSYTAPRAGTYYLGISGYANDSYNPNVVNSGNAASYTGSYTLVLQNQSAGNMRLSTITATASRGTPAQSAIASANIGQTITLTGNGFSATEQVVFTTLSDNGFLGEASVGVTSVSADRRTLTVVVPTDATTGRVRLANDLTGILLQIVPTLDRADMSNGASFSGGLLTLSGSGFAEAAEAVNFGTTVLTDIGRAPYPDVYFSNSAQYVTVPVPAASGPLTVSTVGGASNVLARSFTGLTATSTSGHAADPGQASANPGQTITISGIGLASDSDLVFRVIDTSGYVSDRIVQPLTVSANGRSAQVVVPLDAITGSLRLVGDSTGSARQLQIVPIVTGVDIRSVASNGKTMLVVLSGYGFTKGDGSYHFGDTVVTDESVANVNLGYDRSRDQYFSGSVTLTVPVLDTTFGDISFITAGGRSAAFTVSLTSIDTTALSGTPADTTLASANPAQAVTLNGAGLSTATDVLLHYTNQSGSDRTLLLNPTAAAADGSSATLLIPAYANGVTRLQILGSASQPLLQIVPVVNGFDVQYTNRLQIDGLGFVEGASTYLFTGTSLTDTAINAGPDVTYASPVYIENGTAYVDNVAHGFGSVRISTAGGTSAPRVLNALDPALGELSDVALATDGSLWVIDFRSRSPSHLLHLDAASGALLGSFNTDILGSSQAGLQVVPQTFTLGNKSIAAGSLLVSAYNQILAYDPDSGTLLTTLTLPNVTTPRLNGALYDPTSGHLFGLDYYNNSRIIELDPSDGALLASFNNPFGLGESFVLSAGIGLDSSTGHLWVVSYFSQEAVEITKTGSVVRRVNLAVQHADGNEASGIAVAADGSLLVSSLQGQVYRIEPDYVAAG